MGRGRNPSLSENELIEAIESVTSPDWLVADTEEVLEQLADPPTKRTVRDTLQDYNDDTDSVICGRKPGEQTWVWWTLSSDENSK